ncbi:glycosyl transferase [Tabrizicola sp. TH137]|uniref:glycosyltransferase family 2 protein n=1 Tax=Tabrizicola sp. TH137 TaxID=2067452 RepID=UPI000C7C1E50|nr:glycosyltransferase [Tabrizicola sp. TH137]PLL11609.1 glycosyl transferase [Tabrizicola sp. TH137]
MPSPPPDRPVGAAASPRPSRRNADRPPFGGPALPDPHPTASGLAEAAAAFLPAAPRLPPATLAPAPVPASVPAPVFDPLAVPPDIALVTRYGAHLCLRQGLLPWQSRDGEILILTATPMAFETHRAALSACFGPKTRPLPCPRHRIEAALLAHGGAALAHSAEYALPPQHSARSLPHRSIALVMAGAFLATLTGLLLAPLAAATALLLLGLCSLYALFALKLLACIATLRRPPPSAPDALPDDLLPMISVLIPLYGEAEIATRLLRRLARLDYPADRLDILILTEADDHPTRAILAASTLPQGVRVLAVPQGQVRTKPRALNFGLDFCKGGIVGIWDAEDAPDPDQLRKVAAAFAAAPPDLACLQGALDFYNPRTNWMARCFTMEYALWFRLFLPGLERLNLPMPLGGTTLFLRRDRIESAGGWDAHNVTEDADLGLRLARMGFRTATLDSSTMEEANCRIRPWIKQRSRWTKGYLMTWLVHMRAPRRLLRDLGLRRFLAVQALLLGSLIHGALGPLILLLWLYSLPLLGRDWLPLDVPPQVSLSLLLIRLTEYALVILAMRRTRHGGPGWWLLLLKPYGLLATIAAIKAIGEAPLRPFHWDKTRHGQFHDDDTIPVHPAGAAQPDTPPDSARAPAPPTTALSASVSRPPPPEAGSRRPC